MKKNIFGFMLVAAVVMSAFTACSDDENEGKYGEASSVQIVTADVLFEARASEGTITFTAPGDATVNSSSSWCATRLEGNTVYVSAETNDDLVSRSALITIKCGTDSANVTVQQQGVLFRFANDANEFAASSNDAQTLKVPFTTNVDTYVESDCDWMHVSIADNDTLLISFDENTTGHVRTASFRYKAGGYVGEVPVSQYDFDQNIAGNGSVYWHDLNSTTETNAATVVARDYITLGGQRVPVVFEESTMTFKLYAGNKLYTETISKETCDVVVTLSNGGNYLTWGSGVSLSGKPEYNEETGKTEIRFVDNGSASGTALNGVLFYAFLSGAAFSSSTMRGYVDDFIDIRIER